MRQFKVSPTRSAGLELLCCLLAFVVVIGGCGLIDPDIRYRQQIIGEWTYTNDLGVIQNYNFREDGTVNVVFSNTNSLAAAGMRMANAGGEGKWSIKDQVLTITDLSYSSALVKLKWESVETFKIESMSSDQLVLERTTQVTSDVTMNERRVLKRGARDGKLGPGVVTAQAAGAKCLPHEVAGRCTT